MEDKHAKQAQSGELVVSYDLKMMGGHGPDVKSRGRYYSLSKDRKNKRRFKGE